MLIVTLVPTCAQSAAFIDVYPVNVFPLRTTFTQYGKFE